MAKSRKGDSKSRRIEWSSLKRGAALYKYIRPYQAQFWLGMVFLFLSSSANLAFPKFLGDLVNASSSENFEVEVRYIALMLFGILLLQATFSYFRIILFVRVAEKALASLRQATYEKLLSLPMRFFNSRRVGELNSRISSDITQLQETFTTTFAEFVRQLVIVGGGITLLMMTSVQLTLFMLAILPVVVLAAVAFGRFIRKYSKQVQDEVAASNTIVEETLQGISSVKAYANEFFELSRYKKKTDEVAQIAIKGGHYRAAFASFIVLGLFGAVVAVIWRGSLLIGKGEMDAGQLFSFVLYSSFIGGSIGGMADVYARIQRAVGATEELLDIFDSEEESIIVNKPIPEMKRLNGEIEFKNVSFSYPSREEVEVIKSLSFRISAGQTAALVGSSGSGKTTLTNLLLGFYTLSRGDLLIDGQSLSSFNLSGFRKQLALVPQDVFLFGGSIGENISYGKPEADQSEIEEAARKAYAHDFISAFPEGYNTMVGERGIQLSGGQRQRVAIARAMLKDPAILLLDEATSALDSESEAEVQKALDALMKGRTSIVIAHRLSTVKHADKVLVLEAGQLVEEGSPADLMARDNSRFKDLQRLQHLPN
jgi:ABC-type multidrug transport system fused ATPase/permease subunit